MDDIKKINNIKAIKLNGKNMNIGDLDSENFHKEILKSLNYDDIDDYREFFKADKTSDIVSNIKTNSENNEILNPYIKSSSNSDVKIVSIYFLLEDETGEFLSDEYKIKFAFNEKLQNKIDNTINNSISDQDKTIMDARKYLFGQYKIDKNELMLYNFYDNRVEIAINKSKNDVNLFKPLSFIINTRGTGLKTTVNNLSSINDLDSISINNDPSIYTKSNTAGIKNTINKELEIVNTNLKSYIDKSFKLNLYSSKDQIKFKRTIEISITNDFEKLSKELEKIK